MRAVSMSVRVRVVRGNRRAPLGSSAKVAVLDIHARIDHIGRDTFATDRLVHILVECAERQRALMRNTRQTPRRALLRQVAIRIVPGKRILHGTSAHVAHVTVVLRQHRHIHDRITLDKRHVGMAADKRDVLRRKVARIPTHSIPHIIYVRDRVSVPAATEETRYVGGVGHQTIRRYTLLEDDHVLVRHRLGPRRLHKRRHRPPTGRECQRSRAGHRYAQQHDSYPHREKHIRAATSTLSTFRLSNIFRRAQAACSWFFFCHDGVGGARHSGHGRQRSTRVCGRGKGT